MMISFSLRYDCNYNSEIVIIQENVFLIPISARRYNEDNSFSCMFDDVLEHTSVAIVSADRIYLYSCGTITT